jgi:hypothetical protein
MPTKVRLIKLLDEIRDVGYSPLRRAPLKPVMLYLMELRSHAADAHLPKKRLIITVDLQNSPDIPHPVKITHLQPSEPPPVPAMSH